MLVWPPACCVRCSSAARALGAIVARMLARLCCTRRASTCTAHAVWAHRGAGLVAEQAQVCGPVHPGTAGRGDVPLAGGALPGHRQAPSAGPCLDASGVHKGAQPAALRPSHGSRRARILCQRHIAARQRDQRGRALQGGQASAGSAAPAAPQQGQRRAAGCAQPGGCQQAQAAHAACAGSVCPRHASWHRLAMALLHH